MSDAPDLTPPAAAAICPQCGGSSAHPFNVGGVCLRCAGLRVLADEAFALPPPAEPTDLNTPPRRIGPYEIIEEIGRGGMGCVYAASQPGLGRIVALKVLATHATGGAAIELRFLREAQTAARLRHPHIVPVHDFGRTDAGVYFTMDYIDGGDLAQRLRRGDAFSPRAAADLVRKLADALAHTHAQGVLHRDLKPSNVLLDGDEPLLADFGLAAQLEPGGDLTAATRVLGTPHYLAPEAMRDGSAALSPLSDVYALGVILYEMLAGRTPFAGASLATLPALVDQHPPPALALLAPEAPRDLATICHQCLEHDPARRYTGAAELAADLARFLAGETVQARAPSATERCLRFARRHRAAVGSTVAIALALIGATIFSSWQAVRASRAERAALAAEARSQDNLREARLAEARALRQTTEPGRRRRALAALAQAARIRPGLDLRNAAVGTLLLQDVAEGPDWDLHTSGPHDVIVSPDGTVFILSPLDAQGNPGNLRLHHWRDPAPFATVDFSTARRVTDPIFTPDSRLFGVRCGDDSIRLYDTRSGALRGLLDGHPLADPDSMEDLRNRDFSFSVDSQHIAIGLPGGGCGLYRVDDAVQIAAVAGEVRLSNLLFSPHGRWLAATNTARYDVPAQVWIYDANTLALVRTLDLPALPQSITWSADGRLLAVLTSDQILSQYDIAAGRLAHRFPTPSQDTFMVAYLAGDRLIASRGAGSRLSFVDATLGTPEFHLEGLAPIFLQPPVGSTPFYFVTQTTRIVPLQFIPPVGHHLLAATSPDGAELGSEPLPFDLSADERWFVIGGGRFTIIREFATGREVARWDRGVALPFDFSAAVFAADGNSLFRGACATGLFNHPITRRADGTLAIGEPRPLNEEPGWYLVDVSRNRRRFLQVSPETETVRVLDLDATGDGVSETTQWHVPHPYSAVFDPTATRVLVNSDPFPPDAAFRHPQLHDANTGALIRTLDAPVGADARWSRDGRSAMTSNGLDLSIVWDTTTWTRRAEFRDAVGGQISTFGLSPDGTLAAVFRDDTFHLLRVTDQAELLRLQLPGSSSMPMAVTWLPDGERVAIRWWDGRFEVLTPRALIDAANAALNQK